MIDYRNKKRRMTFIISCCLLAGLLSGPLAAQEKGNPLSGSPDHPNYTVRIATDKIIVDGILQEKSWADAAVIKLPFEYMPGDNISGPVDTDFLVTFDDKYLYLGYRCYDPDPSKIRAHLMDRDAIDTFIQDDHVVVMIDMFNDERRGFQFRANPLGVQADANFSENEGYEDFSWDAIWKSVGKITEWGWTMEIAIPFNQLRFPQTQEVQTWGFNAERSYPRNVRHRMASHKRKRDVNCILCQFNKITGFQGMKTGLNLEVVPTLTANRTDERVDFPNGDIENGTISADPGLSLRWGITPNMMLNAAINPDFSQVEADVRELEVNTRFAIRYPEKRPFFLEGADLFLTPIEAVFTRTVADPAGGFKFTGKIGKNAVGLFGTLDAVNNLLFPSNQGSMSAALDQDVMGGVFRFRRDIGRGSTLGAIYTG
ncbi:MAG: carbohydrate binding family 9 domain-containing protein, partial [Candidatus Aminicenantes bacterium]|nr:carbohydrate binding family 9 domain-containing protein [Candidatus Aminicenantes bacterium]